MNQATTSLQGKSVTDTRTSTGRDFRVSPGGGPLTALVLGLLKKPDFAALRLVIVALGGLGFSALTFGLAGMLPGDGILYAGALATTASFGVLSLALDARSAAVAVAHLATGAAVFALALLASPGSITGALILTGAWTLAFGVRRHGQPGDYGLTPLLVGSGSYLLATGAIGLLAIV